MIYFTDKDILGEEVDTDTSDYTVRPMTRVFIKNEKGEFLFVESKWPPHIFDLVGGGADAGESMEDCARREAMEEAGATIKNLKKIAEGSGYMHDRKTTLDIHYFLADIVDIGPLTSIDEREQGKEARWFTNEQYIEYVQDYLIDPNTGRKLRPMVATLYLFDKYVDNRFI